MPDDKPNTVIANDVIPNDWASLRQFTSARIALGRAGTSLPTAPHLAFQLAHARARTAVHHALGAAVLIGALQAGGHAVLYLKSAAGSRAQYLQRPEMGRQLDEASRATLADLLRPVDKTDVAFVIGDGLSAAAVEQHAAALLDAVIPKLKDSGWRIAPLVVVEGARVAIGDEIGANLNAACVVVLIGERPGLSSPDSMGAYLTYAPRPGLTDEARNCISNIRHEGLSTAEAARTLMYLLAEARKRQLSGVGLKDESCSPAALAAAPRRQFRLAGN
jgi:ethanolamine ammonia-lyase small subunit